MPLSAPRETPELLNPRERHLPVAAGVRLFQGALAVRDAAGFVRPARVAATDVPVGIALEEANNAGGADGAVAARVRRGTYRFRNSAAGDAIARLDIGAVCYVVDDETVAKTHATNTRSAAGRVYDVDAQGVWVEIQ